jgi:hypothetical protein
VLAVLVLAETAAVIAALAAAAMPPSSVAGLAYPARKPASPGPGSVNPGWTATSAADGVVVVIGHLPAGLRPDRLGQLRAPAMNGNPT